MHVLSENTLVLAQSSHGKTTWALDCATTCHLAGHKVYLSADLKELKARIKENALGPKLVHWRQRGEINISIDARNRIFLQDLEKSLDLELQGTLRSPHAMPYPDTQTEHNCDVWILDDWRRLQHPLSDTLCEKISLSRTHRIALIGAANRSIKTTKFEPAEEPKESAFAKAFGFTILLHRNFCDTHKRGTKVPEAQRLKQIKDLYGGTHG